MNGRTTFRRIRRQVSGQGGLSLVELLVAMLIMIVILGAIYTIWFGLQRTYSFTDDDMTAQEQARAAMDEMVELIRTSRQPDPAPSAALAMVIVAADDNSLVCWTDSDRDVNHDLELVRFRVDTTTRTLYRDDSQTGDASFSGAHSVRLVGNWISNNETKPLFSYLSANGTVLETPVADPTQIRQVAIDLLIDIYTDRAPISHELRSVVQPRNLRQY
jgi:Tfp pilus assembly protein PilV